APRETSVALMGSKRALFTSSSISSSVTAERPQQNCGTQLETLLDLITSHGTFKPRIRTTFTGTETPCEREEVAPPARPRFNKAGSPDAAPIAVPKPAPVSAFNTPAKTCVSLRTGIIAWTGRV